jgi:uncharacterized protein
LQSVLKTIEEESKKYKYKQITVHGGEPLLLPIEDLEEILKLNFSIINSTGIQTNLVNLKKDHIKLFQKYKTHVGISLDGNTGELNFGRWNKFDRDKNEIHQKTIETVKNIELLEENGIRKSIIVVLRQYNAKPKKLPELKEFLTLMRSEYNIVDFRLNPLVTFDEVQKKDEELSQEDLAYSYCSLADFAFENPEMQILPFRDIVEMLMGYRNSSCNFGGCDPWHTTAEVCVLPHGGLGCCLKSGAALDGIQAPRANERLRYRYQLLSKLSEKDHGCKDCRFWFICRGGCPGAAVDNDFRNKTSFCFVYKKLFTYIATKIYSLFPNIHLVPDFYPNNPTQNEILKSISKSSWQENGYIKIEKIKQDTKDPGHLDTHADQHIDQHNDEPHNDHWDNSCPRNRKKRENKKIGKQNEIN